MCESLHVAINVYINGIFYIYICSFTTAEVCNLYSVVQVILTIWNHIWKRHSIYFQFEICCHRDSVILIDVNCP